MPQLSGLNLITYRDSLALNLLRMRLEFCHSAAAVVISAPLLKLTWLQLVFLAAGRLEAPSETR